MFKRIEKSIIQRAICNTLTSFINLNLESCSTLAWNSLASLQWFLTYSCSPVTPKFLMTNHSFSERKRRLNGIPQCYLRDLYLWLSFREDDYSVVYGRLWVAVLKVQRVHNERLSQFVAVRDPSSGKEKYVRRSNIYSSPMNKSTICTVYSTLLCLLVCSSQDPVVSHKF